MLWHFFIIGSYLYSARIFRVTRFTFPFFYNPFIHDLSLFWRHNITAKKKKISPGCHTWRTYLNAAAILTSRPTRTPRIFFKTQRRTAEIARFQTTAIAHERQHGIVIFHRVRQCRIVRNHFKMTLGDFLTPVNFLTLPTLLLIVIHAYSLQIKKYSPVKRSI